MLIETLKVRFNNGEEWEIDAAPIAENRAKYYAEKGDSYHKEYDYAIQDRVELIDWMTNNMDGGQVERFSRRVKEARKPSFHELMSESILWIK